MLAILSYFEVVVFNFKHTCIYNRKLFVVRFYKHMSSILAFVLFFFYLEDVSVYCITNLLCLQLTNRLNATSPQNRKSAPTSSRRRVTRQSRLLAGCVLYTSSAGCLFFCHLKHK